MVPRVGGSSPLAHPEEALLWTAIRNCASGPAGRRRTRRLELAVLFVRSGHVRFSPSRGSPPRIGRVGPGVTLCVSRRFCSDFRVALVAQLAEQGTLNPKVEGSIPSERTLRK